MPPFSLANIPLTPETARDQERRIRREIANSNERRRMQSINAGFQSLKTLIPHSDGEKLSKVGHEERFELGDELDVTVRVWTHLHNKPVTFFFFSFPQAAILQQTAEYIFTLEQEKTRLLQQNSQLKRIIQVNHHRAQPETANKAVNGLFCLSVSLVLVFVQNRYPIPVCSPQELSGSSPKRRRAEEKDEGIGSPDILEEEKTEDLRREMIELRQQLEKERSVRMILEDQVTVNHDM